MRRYQAPGGWCAFVSGPAIGPVMLADLPEHSPPSRDLRSVVVGDGGVVSARDASVARTGDVHLGAGRADGHRVGDIGAVAGAVVGAHPLLAACGRVVSDGGIVRA